jgi:hypothetical protein
MLTEPMNEQGARISAAPGDRWFVLALFITFTSLAILCTNFPTWGWPGGDGRDYANLTEALVEGQSFDLRNSSRPMRRSDDPTVVLADDGSIYSIFPMGKALVQAPMLALARWFGQGASGMEKKFLDNFSFSVTSAILYGLSACFVYLLLFHHLHFSFPLSVLGAALYALGTLAFSFSKIHGVESFQIVLFMGMVYFSLQPGRWSLALVSLCFSWAVVTKPPSAIALPVLAYLFFKNGLWRRAHWPSRILAIVFAAGFAALFFYYNWLRSGDPAASYAVGHAAESTFSLARIPKTLWPLLFGPERNLFLNNPILLLAIPGFFLLRNSVYLWTAGGLWITMLLLYGSSGNTNWGAYVGNGRYAVPFIFLLIPFVLATLRWFSGLQNLLLKWGMYLSTVALMVASMYVQLLYASYTEFHVKQFERTYNRAARKVDDIPTLPEAVHQLRFAHTIYWHTRSCQQPSRMEYFPYPSQEPPQAGFAAKVLKTFPNQFFCKDYLFLADEAFRSLSWYKSVRMGVGVMFLCGFVLLFICASRRRSASLSAID